jgi:hypothetical protein
MCFGVQYGADYIFQARLEQLKAVLSAESTVNDLKGKLTRLSAKRVSIHIVPLE